MKRIFLVIILIITFTDSYSQIRELSSTNKYKSGDFEFGVFMNIGRSTSIWNSEANLYFHLGGSVGYYIISKLSFEPEVDFNFSSENSLLIVLGNFNYTFYSPLKDVSPYLKIGFGLTKTGEFNYYYDSQEPDWYKIINTGAGIKIKYTESLAFKIELNYRNLNTDIESAERARVKLNKDIISLMFGISILY